MISSLHLGICRSKATPLSIWKNNNNKKGKINNFKSHFVHSIKGCCPLWQMHGVLIPSLCINNSQTLLFKICRPLLVFLTFSSNKCCWWLPLVFSLGDERVIIYFLLSSHLKVGCDNLCIEVVKYVGAKFAQNSPRRAKFHPCESSRLQIRPAT